jgi:hypothetical protein
MAMTEHPIIFTYQLAAALRDGRKTQTRRLLTTMHRGTARRSAWARLIPGARLWVKETWTRHPDALGGGFAYGSDPLFEGFQAQASRNWKPAKWMPREASRLDLIVTAIRFQRLQDITPEDALAEGITEGDLGWGVRGFPGSWRETPREAFAALWDEIHDREDWDSNPEVAALTFTVEHRTPQETTPE